MEFFTQAQAAKLVRIEERAFRVLLDEGTVQATPETKDFGRGKQKLFSRDEVRLASILNQINLRENRHRPLFARHMRESIPSLVEWGKKATEENPHYFCVEMTPNGYAMGGQRAQGFIFPGLIPFVTKDKEGDNKLISVMMDRPDGSRTPAKTFVAVNLADALWWDRLSDDELAKELDPSTELDKIFEGLRP